MCDHRSHINRIGQQLVFNPGSTMVAKEVKVTSTGPALGEVISEGAILGPDQQVLALFRQRFRAWLGRPLLEGSSRFINKCRPRAIRGTPILELASPGVMSGQRVIPRGVNGTGSLTTHTRPETPDYLELRSARQGTVLFPGGLPFHQPPRRADAGYDFGA